MSARAELRQTDSRGPMLTWWCPGCEMPHAVTVGGAGWTWDGSLELPTLSPSVLVTMTPSWPEKPKRVCHSFVRSGRMEFLGDCTHRLAGQTVELEPWPPAPEVK